MMTILSNPLFIAIVAAVIAGLILFFVFGIGKPKHESEHPLSSVTPTDIYDNLDKLPPFQVKQASSNYRGRKIKWDVQFSNTYSILGIHYVHSHPAGKPLNTISFRISLRRYPEIKTMKRGDKFIVQGTIFSVDTFSVNLKNCRLFFSNEKPKLVQEISKQITTVQNTLMPTLPFPTSQPNTLQPLSKSESAVTIEEIMQTLDRTPPYQRNDAAKNYIGLKVFWLVEFRSINTSLDGMQLIAMPPNNPIAGILCPIDIERYPQFKTMKSGKNLTIEGIIAEVTYSNISLRDCNIHFTE